MGKPTSKEGQSERLHMRISPEEIEAIDDWRFANRVGSRSDAVRRLCGIGMIASRDMRKINERLPRVLEQVLREPGEQDAQSLAHELQSLFLILQATNTEMARFYRDDAFEELQGIAEKLSRKDEK